MAKYCPKCCVGVSADDTVCGNCGNVLEAEMVAEKIVSEEIVSEDLGFINVSPERPPLHDTPPLRVENTAKVMSLKDWMITLLLLLIPIVNIVMLIIWSVDSNTNENRKHFAWAQLIYMGIGLVITIIFSSIIVSIIMASLSTLVYY